MRISKLVKSMLKDGGVGLTVLVRTEARQADLFFGPDVRRERNMDVLDKINAKYTAAARWALVPPAGGLAGVRHGEAKRGSKDAQWRPILKSLSLSPSYTTKVERAVAGEVKP